MSTIRPELTLHLRSEIRSSPKGTRIFGVYSARQASEPKFSAFSNTQLPLFIRYTKKGQSDQKVDVTMIFCVSSLAKAKKEFTKLGESDWVFVGELEPGQTEHFYVKEISLA